MVKGGQEDDCDACGGRGRGAEAAGQTGRYRHTGHEPHRGSNGCAWQRPAGEQGAWATLLLAPAGGQGRCIISPNPTHPRHHQNPPDPAYPPRCRPARAQTTPRRPPQICLPTRWRSCRCRARWSSSAVRPGRQDDGVQPAAVCSRSGRAGDIGKRARRPCCSQPCPACRSSAGCSASQTQPSFSPPLQHPTHTPHHSTPYLPPPRRRPALPGLLWHEPLQQGQLVHGAKLNGHGLPLLR